MWKKKDRSKSQSCQLTTHRSFWKLPVQQFNDCMKFSNSFLSIIFYFCLHLEKLCVPSKKKKKSCIFGNFIDWENSWFMKLFNSAGDTALQAKRIILYSAWRLTRSKCAKTVSPICLPVDRRPMAKPLDSCCCLVRYWWDGTQHRWINSNCCSQQGLKSTLRNESQYLGVYANIF